MKGFGNSGRGAAGPPFSNHAPQSMYSLLNCRRPGGMGYTKGGWSPQNSDNFVSPRFFLNIFIFLHVTHFLVIWGAAPHRLQHLCIGWLTNWFVNLPWLIDWLIDHEVLMHVGLLTYVNNVETKRKLNCTPALVSCLHNVYKATFETSQHCLAYFWGQTSKSH